MGSDWPKRYPLVSAAIHGRMKILLRILDVVKFEKPADLHDMIDTALFWTLRHGWTQIARILLNRCFEYQVEIMITRCNLVRIVQSRHIASIEVLLYREAEYLKADQESYVEAYSWAYNHGETTICRIFDEYGLNLVRSNELDEQRPINQPLCYLNVNSN